jgi:hypothetical protein
VVRLQHQRGSQRVRRARCVAGRLQARCLASLDLGRIGQQPVDEGAQLALGQHADE